MKDSISRDGYNRYGYNHSLQSDTADKKAVLQKKSKPSRQFKKEKEDKTTPSKEDPIGKFHALKSGSGTTTVQKAKNEEGELQLKKKGVLQEPSQQKEQEGEIQRKELTPAQSNNTGLPDHLKSGVESLSGYSMDHVKVHYNSDRPAQLQAHAFAQGSDIHVAPGQEKHLPHEAWHVVQQAQGRVKPTMQMKDKVNVNDDEGLEKEADMMGGKALQMMTSENAMLTPLSGNTSDSATSSGTGIVQRAILLLDGTASLKSDASDEKKKSAKVTEKAANKMKAQPHIGNQPDPKKNHDLSYVSYDEESDSYGIEIEAAMAKDENLYIMGHGKDERDADNNITGVPLIGGMQLEAAAGTIANVIKASSIKPSQYTGIIYLTGCYTGAEGTKQESPAKIIAEYLRKMGFVNTRVVGNIGPTVSFSDGKVGVALDGDDKKYEELFKEVNQEKQKIRERILSLSEEEDSLSDEMEKVKRDMVLIPKLFKDMGVDVNPETVLLGLEDYVSQVKPLFRQVAEEMSKNYDKLIDKRKSIARQLNALRSKQKQLKKAQSEFMVKYGKYMNTGNTRNGDETMAAEFYKVDESRLVEG